MTGETKVPTCNVYNGSEVTHVTHDHWSIFIFGCCHYRISPLEQVRVVFVVSFTSGSIHAEVYNSQR